MSISWVLEKERANKRYKQGLRAIMIVMFVLFCFFSSFLKFIVCNELLRVVRKSHDKETG